MYDDGVCFVERWPERDRMFDLCKGFILWQVGPCREGVAMFGVSRTLVKRFEDGVTVRSEMKL